MTAMISLDDLRQSLSEKGYTGNPELIEATYKDLSFPWAHNYVSATELDLLAVKLEIAAQMGFSPVGEVQIQTRSSIKSANAEFYKYLFVQAIQRQTSPTAKA